MKDLRTEEEAENRTLWGRVVKSATWAEAAFVKKRDVARESWETEGHEKNKGIGNGKKDARIQSNSSTNLNRRYRLKIMTISHFRASHIT